MGQRIDSSLDLLEEATPATPAAGWLSLYAKSDHNLYTKDSSGREVRLDNLGSVVARAHLTAQTVVATAGAWTKVPLDTKTTPSYDPNSNFDTTTANKGRYTCPVTGYYQVNGQITLNAGSGIVGIRRNATEATRGERNTMTGFVSYIVSDIVYCVANDYLELWVYNLYVSNQTLTPAAGGMEAYMSVAQVA